MRKQNNCKRSPYQKSVGLWIEEMMRNDGIYLTGQKGKWMEIYMFVRTKNKEKKICYKSYREMVWEGQGCFRAIGIIKLTEFLAGPTYMYTHKLAHMNRVFVHWLVGSFHVWEFWSYIVVVVGCWLFPAKLSFSYNWHMERQFEGQPKSEFYVEMYAPSTLLGPDHSTMRIA